jgi:predicted amidohydrolase
LTPGVELIPAPTDPPPADPADPGQPTTLNFTVFEIHGVRCALAICADMGIHDVFRATHALGVEVLMNPAGGGGRREHRVTTEELRTPEGRAIYVDWLEKTFFPGAGTVGACLEWGMCYTGVNMCGYDGKNQYHMGHGMIVTPQGEVPGFFHGLPNLDRQRPMYTHAVVEFAE